MAVTVKDVAALAGVSPSTVSRVCKNNPSISRETRERVRRAMTKLGYEPATASAAASPMTAADTMTMMTFAEKKATAAKDAAMMI